MTRSLRTVALVLGGLAAGAVGAATVQAGLSATSTWAYLGAALVGALCAMERVASSDASRAGRAFVGGALVGLPAGVLARTLAQAVGPVLAQSAPALESAAVETLAYLALGLVAGAAPGFFSFSGALSRDGAVGGVLGGAAGGAMASLAPPWLRPFVGAACVAVGYVTWRRTHAAARLVAMVPETALTKQITLREHWVSVGTGPECDLRLDDSNIQYLRPLVLTYRDGTYWVEDLSSKPGALKVNGKVATRQALEDGDVLEVGNSRYRFERIDPRARA